VAIWTADDVANLKAAIASGVLTVSFAGPPARTVTYQDLGEMRKLLAEMIRDVNGTATVTHRNAVVSRGFRRIGCAPWRRND
jgi:hypothetical protein